MLWGFSFASVSQESLRVLPGANSWANASQQLIESGLSVPLKDTLEIGDSGLWLHVDLKNSNLDILYFPSDTLDRYRIYSHDSNTVLYDSGLRNASILVWNPETMLPIRRAWGSQFLLYLEAPAESTMPFEFLSFEEYQQAKSPELINNGMYYGCFALMSVFCLLLSVFNKDPEAWKLGVTMFVWLLLSLAIWGYGNTPLPYNFDVTLRELTNQLVICASLASAWFGVYFLAKSAGHSLIYKGLKVCIWLQLTYLAGSFILGTSWVLVLGLALVSTLLGTLTAIVAVFNEDKAARYMIAATVCSSSPFIFIWFQPLSQQTTIAAGMMSLVLIMLALMQRVGKRFHTLGLQAKVASERERFLASMSHEIRTPLNGIIGFSELCSQEDLQGDVKHYFHQIDRSSKMLLGIVNDVLDYSKLQATNIDVASESMQVQRILEDVMTINKPVADLNAISLDYVIAENVAEYVITDPFRCAQILINLCGNAVKFSRNGNVKIKVFRENSDILFQVIDDGIGIEEDVLASLFNPFSQADDSIARKFGGTGLGLAISNQLCQLLDGELTAVSEIGKGSTFTFSLPYRKGKAPVATPKANIEKLQGKRILLAEDNIVNLQLATRILEKNGLLIDSATDGKIALEKATINHYDFILMDMQMPELSGPEATEKIRKLGFKQPIIAMSANTSQSDRDTCLNAGMNDYLAKPIEQQQLLKKLELWSVVN